MNLQLNQINTQSFNSNTTAELLHDSLNEVTKHTRTLVNIAKPNNIFLIIVRI